MLQNAYFLAKIGADTAENEQHSAEILPKDAEVRRLTRVEPNPPFDAEAAEDVARRRLPAAPRRRAEQRRRGERRARGRRRGRLQYQQFYHSKQSRQILITCRRKMTDCSENSTKSCKSPV